MSDPKVLHDTSLTLKALLEARLNSGGGALGAPVSVTIDSPHRGNQEQFRINLFLYNLVQDEGRRNSGGWVPLERTASAQRFAAEPLALRLFYLVTAFAVDGLTEHHLLGEAMQVLHANRRIPEAQLKGSLRTGRIRAEHVEVSLLNLDVEGLQKIWGSQTEPLRTSVAYQVDAVFLDATEAGAEVRLVEEREVEVLPFPQPITVAPPSAPPGAEVRLYGSGLVVPQPVTGRNLVRVWFGDVEAELVPDGAAPGVVRVAVPASLEPGRVLIALQLDRYISSSISFDVEEAP